MNDCLFCTLAADKANLVWESDTVAAFRDKYPDAPVHILVVPKRHLASLNELDDPALAGQLLMAVRAVAAGFDLAKGYRTIINTGHDGGQVVNHLHIHVLGGKHFAEKSA